VASHKITVEINRTPSDPPIVPDRFELVKCPVCCHWYVEGGDIRERGEENFCCSFDCPICTIDNLNVWIDKLDCRGTKGGDDGDS
jgi:hypothetical protein